MEHRCGTRHKVDLAVYARAHAGVVSSVGWLRDVSLTGGFLETALPAQPLAHISLRLIDGDGQLGPRLEGQVVRRASNGLGIEWSEYATDLIRALGRNSEMNDFNTTSAASGSRTSL
jgi:hypothetical protein